VVLVLEVERVAQGDRHHDDEHRHRHALDPRRLHERHEDQQGERHEADREDLRVERHDAVRHLREQLEGLTRLGARTEERVDLLADDDDADRREHAVDDRGGEHVAERSRAHEREDDLHHAGDDDHRERPAVAELRVAVPELRHGRERDGDEAGGRTFDRELRAPEEGRGDATDDRREDAGDRREVARHRDAEAERQRDEEDDEPSAQICEPALARGQLLRRRLGLGTRGSGARASGVGHAAAISTGRAEERGA
jgi:hypothetical protein